MNNEPLKARQFKKEYGDLVSESAAKGAYLIWKYGMVYTRAEVKAAVECLKECIASMKDMEEERFMQIQVNIDRAFEDVIEDE